MRSHLHHMEHTSDLICHSLQLGYSLSKVMGEVVGKLVKPMKILNLNFSKKKKKRKGAKR